MALDNIVLERITNEMAENLIGAFLDMPYALGINQYAIPFHGSKKLKANGESGRGVIILFLDSSKPFLTYSLDKFTKTNDNTPFFNALKKLSGTKIEAIFKTQGERVITIKTIVMHKELGDFNQAYDLVVELFPSRPNAYLVAYPYGKIIALFKERGDILSKRYLTRNIPYTYPPSRRRLDESVESLEEAKPLLSYEIYRRLSQESERIGYQNALKDMLNSQSLYYDNGYVYPSKLDLVDAKPVKVTQIYECFVQDQKSLAKELREKDLVDRLQKALKTTKKKIKNLKEDYENSQNKLVYKDYGNLLFLYQTSYEPGMTVMECDGVQIKLDPKKDIIENANSYFKQYKKAKQAVVTLGELQKKADDELAYLEKKLLEVPLASNRDLMELKEELVLEGYFKDPSKGRKKIVRKKSYSPHIITTSNGDRIGFGMNDLQNETLTFDIATSHDLFFHIKDYPGSHVVVLDGNDNDEDRLLASELALFLSHKDSGDIMVTPRKFVKKNPNKTGLVNILKYETIHLNKIRDDSIALFKKSIAS